MSWGSSRTRNLPESTCPLVPLFTLFYICCVHLQIVVWERPGRSLCKIWPSPWPWILGLALWDPVVAGWCSLPLLSQILNFPFWFDFLPRGASSLWAVCCSGLLSDSSYHCLTCPAVLAQDLWECPLAGEREHPCPPQSTECLSF